MKIAIHQGYCPESTTESCDSLTIVLAFVGVTIPPELHLLHYQVRIPFESSPSFVVPYLHKHTRFLGVRRQIQLVMLLR